MVNNKQEILRIYQEFASITSHVLIHLMHEGEEEAPDAEAPMCNHEYPKDICPYCHPSSDTAPPPEKQYRDLEPGEMIQDGDEYSFSGNDWITTELHGGKVNKHGNRYRRPE